jgi:D-cysteine desulfhydrase
MREMCGKLNRIAVLEAPFAPTPIVRLSGDYGNNEIYVKRDDLIPFSFGGNKARKAQCFYRDILRNQPDVIVTYGSNSSNHCRIIANMARSMGLPCHIISTDHEVAGKDGRELFNRILVRDFGASIETVPVEKVHDTIEHCLGAYRAAGKKPYFIQGGGHGDIGTAAYYETFFEILAQEEEMGLSFAHIFHASGTGATQGGLVAAKTAARNAAQLTAGTQTAVRNAEELASGTKTAVRKAAQLSSDTQTAACDALLRFVGASLPEIVGISIARKNPRGRAVVRESVTDYLDHQLGGAAHFFREEDLIFDDHYILGGYGEYTDGVRDLIGKVMAEDGIPMDTTYVGKAFYGMLQYLKDHDIHGQQVLFLHTGGTPLYFDRL